MNDDPELDADVMAACQACVDEFCGKTFDLWAATVRNIFVKAKVHDLESAAALCDRMDLEVGCSDDGRLLLITPWGKPVFVHGDTTATNAE